MCIIDIKNEPLINKKYIHINLEICDFKLCKMTDIMRHIVLPAPK